MVISKTNKGHLHDFPIHTILVILGFLTFYPLIFTVITSFKDNEQFYKHFWSLPSPFIFANYADAFKSILPYLGNSVYISAVSIVILLLTASMSAYAFARLRFPAKEQIFMAILALLMIPGLLELIPQFTLLKKFGLLDRYAGIILGYITGSQAFSIFIIRSFFSSQPEELFEAARIDGANELRAYLNIALPLVKPVLGSVAIVTLLGIWNDYLWPLIVTSDINKYTIALGLIKYKSMFSSTILYGPLFAGYVVTALPLIILFMCLMNYFLEGLTTGAIKM